MLPWLHPSRLNLLFSLLLGLLAIEPAFAEVSIRAKSAAACVAAGGTVVAAAHYGLKANEQEIIDDGAVTCAGAMLLTNAVLYINKKCPGLFSRIKNQITAPVNLYTGRATGKLDERAFAIFERYRLNPDAALSAEEQEFLRSKNLDILFGRYRDTNSFVKKINELMAIPARSQPITANSKNFRRSVLDLEMKILLPGLPVAPTEAAERLFARALRSNNYELTEKETAFLKQWSLLEDFQRFAKEAPQHRGAFLLATRVRESANYARWGLIGTGMVGTATLPFMAERVSDPEVLAKKAAEFKGGIQLIYGDEPEGFAIIRSTSQAIELKGNGAKFYKGEKLKELEKKLVDKSLNYNQVFLRANSEEVNKVLDKAKEFVTRKRTTADGKLELDARFFLDAPLGEAYKILQSELGLPPAPLVKRNEAIILSNFSLMKKFGDPKQGRVREVLRVRGKEGSDSEHKEAFLNAVSAYYTGAIFVGKGGAAMASAVVGGIDLMPNTIYQKTIPVKSEQEKWEEDLAKANKANKGQGVLNSLGNKTIIPAVDK
jgi:hypothetical protein